MPILGVKPRQFDCRFKRREAHRSSVKQVVKLSRLFPQFRDHFFGRITGTIARTACPKFGLCRSRCQFRQAVRLVF